ncbi:MAG TPA: hypothetical protein VFK59_02440 [Actinomycetota bacterium]|nr:hypothetical protein [Actinomycetota bacterium]
MSLVVVSALVAAGCGASTTAPDPVPADALPGEVGEVVRLDAGSVADDAIDVEQLGALLEDAGFTGGTQRLFSQTQGIRPQRSLARILAFGDADGARTYLAWLEEHLDEVIGTAELLEPPAVDGDAFLALSEPECLCPKATDVYLAAWAKGSTVLTLEVGGKGVETADVQALVEAFDRAVAA